MAAPAFLVIFDPWIPLIFLGIEEFNWMIFVKLRGEQEVLRMNGKFISTLYFILVWYLAGCVPFLGSWFVEWVLAVCLFSIDFLNILILS